QLIRPHTSGRHFRSHPVLNRFLGHLAWSPCHPPQATVELLQISSVEAPLASDWPKIKQVLLGKEIVLADPLQAEVVHNAAVLSDILVVPKQGASNITRGI